jgi:hypothetical protein
MTGFHLTEFNIARLSEPLDAPANAEFAAVLEAVNLIAEVSPGFVWRLKDDAGRSASFVAAYRDPQLIVNLTVWTDPESLRHFTYRSGHGAYFRRRREWFDEGSSQMACWWTPIGEIPTVDDAMARLAHLAEHGTSERAFTFNDPLPMPSPQ